MIRDKSSDSLIKRKLVNITNNERMSTGEGTKPLLKLIAEFAAPFNLRTLTSSSYRGLAKASHTYLQDRP